MFALIVAGLLGCTGGESSREEVPVTRRTLSQVLASDGLELLKLDGVQTVYESAEDGEPVIKIGVDTLTPELHDRLPGEIEGYRVIVVETGEIAPRDDGGGS